MQLAFELFGRHLPRRGPRYASFKRLYQLAPSRAHYQQFKPWTLSEALQHGLHYAVAYEGSEAIGLTCFEVFGKEKKLKTRYTYVVESKRRQGVAVQLRKALSARFPALLMHRPSLLNEMYDATYKEKKNPRFMVFNVGTHRQPLLKRIPFEDLFIGSAVEGVKHWRLPKDELLQHVQALNLPAAQRKRAEAAVRRAWRRWRKRTRQFQKSLRRRK